MRIFFFFFYVKGSRPIVPVGTRVWEALFSFRPSWRNIILRSSSWVSPPRTSVHGVGDSKAVTAAIPCVLHHPRTRASHGAITDPLLVTLPTPATLHPLPPATPPLPPAPFSERFIADLLPSNACRRHPLRMVVSLYLELS
ncbi:hypothetical protein E2C01_086573 [Portunus trituberculatus]|uniref:Uncharacterized protein n=1 Tax=Portunus trituberculatus TaxID=210409 RepID=A0A5B7J444_PORTR|nr:hypothetical protein [Portunus trituberculatus]